MDGDRQKNKSTYSWAICGACTLLIICTMGTCTNAFSVYLPYITSSGLDASATSLILTVRCLFSLVGMLLVPLFYRFFSLRLGMTLTCMMAACSFLLYSMSDSAPLFYAAAAFAGLGYGLGSLIPVSLMINRWFRTSRGFAMGICTAGTGICTICFPPLITLICEKLSLHMAFLLECLLLLLCALVIWLVLRDTPEETGRTAYAKGEENRKAKAVNHYNLGGFGWPLMISAILMLGGVSTAAPGHFPVLFAGQGYDVYLISVAVSVFGALLAVGKLVYGKVADRMGGYGPSIGFLLFLAAGCFFSCMGGSSVLPMFLAVSLMGFGFPLASVGLSVLSADLADEEHYMSTLKWFQIAYAAGGMMFSGLPGILFEKFGTYVLSYAIFFVMTSLILAAIGIVYHRRALVLSGKVHHSVPVHPLMRIAEIFSFR